MRIGNLVPSGNVPPGLAGTRPRLALSPGPSFMKAQAVAAITTPRSMAVPSISGTLPIEPDSSFNHRAPTTAVIQH